ncbi:MAG TPA: tetratricopeptide repeat protein [Isosphaeraceae bacterium]|jgi:tetratricopeptide (TPR) repeat protein|nr:tetratricopeptide repeat protein [Isosphaeraceae bacterium]
MSENNPREQRAQVFFKTGNDAASKNNFDYAIQMFQEACKLVPDNLSYRNALRSIERRKFGNDPAKVGRLVGARNQPIRMRAKHAKSKQRWADVLEVCEEAFAHNPWDTAAAEDAADAAEQLGLPKLAEWLLETCSAQATDAEFFRHQAHAHEMCENWQKAIFCWERVKKINPYDEQATHAINSLSANATIQRSGLGDAINRASEGKSGPEATEAHPDDVKRMAMSPEDRLRKELQENPERVGLYLELADHYKAQSRLDEAEKVLALALKNLPDEEILKTVHADIQVSRFTARIQKQTQKLAADPTDAEAQAKLQQLTTRLCEYEMQEIRRRMASRPDDPGLHYELGLRLAKVGQHDAAIAEFQQARNSPTHKVQALHQAGLSFEANGVMKLAERSYTDALKTVEATDPEDQTTLNALHYQLGRVSEIQGNLTAAEEHYNEVAANDYAYRDVAQRLRNLNQGPST